MSSAKVRKFQLESLGAEDHIHIRRNSTLRGSPAKPAGRRHRFDDCGKAERLRLVADERGIVARRILWQRDLRKVPSEDCVTPEVDTDVSRQYARFPIGSTCKSFAAPISGRHFQHFCNCLAGRDNFQRDRRSQNNFGARSLGIRIQKRTNLYSRERWRLL